MALSDAGFSKVGDNFILWSKIWTSSVLIDLSMFDGLPVPFVSTNFSYLFKCYTDSFQNISSPLSFDAWSNPHADFISVCGGIKKHNKKVFYAMV